MKKLTNLSRAIVAIAIMLCVGLSSYAYDYDFIVDGIYYDITSSSDKTVAVTNMGIYSDDGSYIDNVVIPETVIYSNTTYSVTSIGDFAFLRFTGLTSVTIPNSVTSIGKRAFYGCTGLTSVTIGNSVTTIGGEAFDGCTGLTSVAIPNSVTSIGEYAFYNCTGLTSVTIPNSVTTIGNSAFSYCTSLATVNFNATNCTTMGSSSYPVFNRCTKFTTLNIGDNVTRIPSSAFKGCTGLTTVNFNATNCTTMGSSSYPVFNGCTKFTKLNIGDNVTNIPDYAFYGCTGLTSVAIPNSVTTIGGYAFDDCTGLTSVTIPNSVTTIGSGAFYGCTGLTSITIPNSVTTIGNYAFKGCTGLTSVTIPNSVTTIGSSAFYGCRGLTSVTIPNSVTTIGSSAFYNCTRLTSVTIGNSVTSIGDYAFDGCTGLTSVTIPNSVTTIGEYAFKGCTRLTSVTIPNSVTSIGDYVFSGCTGLAEVTIGNSVTTISNSAFSGCTGLTTVNFNATNCTTMGSSSYPVFSGCTKFTTLNIGDNVTNIPEYAFYGCTGLTSITIPNSVTTIGYQAFYNCSNLATLSGGDGLSSIGTDAFRGCNKLIDGSVVATTQTTVSINLTSPTQYNLGLYYNDSDKLQAENGVVTFTGLKPNYTNSNYDLALVINGIYCPIKDLSFTTQSFSAYLSGSTTVTSISATGTYTDGDVTILGEGINYGSSVTDYDGNNTITLNNLDPGKSYKIYYSVNTQEGGVYSTSKSFTTAALTWSNGGFTATSTTSARLSVETSCDATAGTGFEWKRYDAPESLAPSKAPCSVVDGMLVGSLRNLNPEVYYTCRPYYTSSSGNTYYGEWITFFTGDANVYFEPEVRTFSERSVVNNTVTVRGYALPGTDDISEQGFEYWKVPASRATATVMTVKASGISMTATLADLEYNSTYRYRAYVKTAQGTFYGAEEEFSTGEDPAGIEYIEVDDSNGFDVTLRENPATATAWVKVAGTSAIEAEYYILTTNGGVVANGFIPADGEYQPIELNIANGLYLMTVTDGSHRKTLRLIVR